MFVASASPSAVSSHKMANSDGNDRSALYSFVHVLARGPRRGILAVSYTFYWSFNFENPPGASSLLNIISACAVTCLDCYIGHCYNRTKWPCKLPHNTANFAVFTGTGYRICSERYSMTFWLLFNVSFEKFDQLFMKLCTPVVVVSERFYDILPFI